MKNSEVSNNHQNKDGGIKTILFIYYFKQNILPYGRLMWQKSRLCSHGLMQQWGFNSWETYAPVLNWISVRSLLYIASMHEFSRRSIDFLLAFTQDDLDVDVFMDIPLWMVVYVKRG